MASNPDEVFEGHEELRRKAEALVHENPLYAMRHPKQDLERLLHEVQIYQAELEVQNEQLRDAEQTLRQTRDLYSDLFNNAPIAYFTLDNSGIITEINFTGMKLLGNRPVKGRALYRYISERDRAAFQEFVGRVQSSDGEYICEVSLLRERGEPRCVLLLEAIRGNDADGFEGEVRIAGTDISALRQAQEELTRFNGDLESRVAERTKETEFLTLQLRALAEALARAEVDERRAIGMKLHDSLAQTLVASRMKLTTLRKRIKDNALGPELSDLDALLAEATQYTRGLISDLNPLPADGGGLEHALKNLFKEMVKYGLQTDYQFNSKCALPNHSAIILYQCVRELLFNVVKHAGVEVARVHVEDIDDRIEISVEDKGVGIAHVDSALVPIEGRHFGLFSVQERMQRLGGMLMIQSRPHEGTSCTLIMPIMPSEAEVAPFNPLLRTRREKHVNASVLIVDDHPAVRKGLKQRLDMHPSLNVVDEAKDGQEAIEKARSLQPNIIIMDINMPVMDGIEATRRIMSEMPDIYVVGLSIRDDERAQREMMSAGAVGLVNKGQPLELLFELLESTCVQAAETQPR